MISKRSAVTVIAILALFVGAEAYADVRPAANNPARRFVRRTSDPATCAAGDVWANITTGFFKGCASANTIGVFTLGGLTQATADPLYVNVSGDTMTGALLVSSGTAAAPSVAFSADADGSGTGLFRSAANSLGIATNGVERWVINSSGALNCATDGGCDIGNGLADPRDLSLKRNLILRGSTSGKITFAAAATTTDYTFTWPAAASGSPGTLFLRDDGAWAVAGSGDVRGPASATDTAIAIYDLATGKLLKNSLALVTAAGSIRVPAAAVIFFGEDINSVGYSDGVGPTWRDGITMRTLTHDVQSLGANRTVTWPDAAGTVTLGGNTFTGTGSVVLATAPTLTTPIAGTVAFAALGTPADGSFTYCSDCTKATPCASGGGGAFAKRIAGAWDCD